MYLLSQYMLTVNVIWHYPLLINFLGLNQLTGFFLGCGKTYHSGKNCHILKSIQEA